MKTMLYAGNPLEPSALLTEQSEGLGNQQVTERDLIWLGCFIDCEGSIQLTRTYGSKSEVALHARIQLPSTDAGLVEEVQRILWLMGINPHIYQHTPKSKNGMAKSAYTLSFQKFSQIKTVLELLLPHLISKAPQARLLLSYINHRTDGGKHSGKKKPITDTCISYWNSMRQLNARGTSETTRIASYGMVI